MTDFVGPIWARFVGPIWARSFRRTDMGRGGSPDMGQVPPNLGPTKPSVPTPGLPALLFVFWLNMKFFWLSKLRGTSPGICNLADHPTKHHPTQHHKLVRPMCSHEEGKSPKTLSECERILSAGKPIKKALSTIMSYKCMLAAAAAWNLQGCDEGQTKSHTAY